MQNKNEGSKPGLKRQSLGLQLLKPMPDDDEHNNEYEDTNTDNNNNNISKKNNIKSRLSLQNPIQIKQEEKQEKFGDEMEDSIQEQLEKLSIQGNSKISEIMGSDSKLAQILPKDGQLKYEMKEFNFLQRLGKGGQGRVDQVMHTPTKKMFALKKISMVNDEKFKKYLSAEIRALITCESQYIVRYNGAFFEEGHVNILLEFMNFGSLSHLLTKIKPVPDVILGIIIYQILQGLSYLHKDMKIIHRDIKPANILINDQGFVKITDFGVCGTTNSVDQLNSWVGTTLYMSPERLRQGHYSYDTDIWSLGMTILECVLGHHPLSGQEASFWTLLEQVQHFKIPEFPKETGSLLQDFITKCLALDGSKRPTVEELLKHDLIKKFKKLEDGGRDKFVKWLNLLKK